MSELVLSNHLASSEATGSDVVFISDLHFDFTERKHKPEAAEQMKDEFITFIKERYANCLLCLAGDFFNSYQKTLAFVCEMEQSKINGFFVLGNHD